MCNIVVKPNIHAKFTLIIDDVIIGEKYTTASKACEKAFKYLKGQNK